MTLVVMAAGMGSRYGGLKQIDPIGPNGEIIIEYSIFDAIRAGFKKVVFVIKRELLETFKEVIGNKISDHIEVEYIFQELSALPKEYHLPADRVKPWGTAHAILCTKDAVHTDFVVINADDFYGSESYELIKKFMDSDSNPFQYSMAGFHLKNTLTENGSVARGICELNSNSNLLSVTERTEIKRDGKNIVFKDEKGVWKSISEETLVSMNMWGFKTSIFNELENLFSKFLNENLYNPKAEFFIPMVVDTLIKNEKIQVKVLKTDAEWYGVTYQEDKENVKRAIGKLAKSSYPKNLWGGF